MNLTPRLAAVASFVPFCDVLADIGTDHAYIPVYLAKKGVIKRCIASDIAQGPACVAQSNVKTYGLEDKISVVVANGLEKVPYADVIILAGMGGRLICEILHSGEAVARRAKLLIIQPMTSVAQVRRFLHDKSFTICDEALAKENEKLYNIIVAKDGAMQVDDDIYYYIGKKLIEKRDELVESYMLKKLLSLDKAIKGLAKSAKGHEKREQLKALSRRLMEVYNDYRS